VTKTLAGNERKHPVRILVYKIRRYEVAPFSEWIGGFFRRENIFIRRRFNLPGKRLARGTVGFVDQARK
jgi:hypothetical protein